MKQTTFNFSETKEEMPDLFGEMEKQQTQAPALPPVQQMETAPVENKTTDPCPALPVKTETHYTTEDIQKWTLTAKMSKKKLNELTGKIRNLKALIYSFKELNGVVGGMERESGIMYSLFQTKAEAKNQYALEKYVDLGKKHNWSIAETSITKLEADIDECMKDCHCHIPVRDKRISMEKRLEIQKEADKHDDEYRRKEKKDKEAYKKILAKAPAGATGIIIAEISENTSDSQTDYFAEETKGCFAIGWRMTQKENFANLRKAAAAFPQTAHMGPGKDMHTFSIYYEDPASHCHERNLRYKNSETYSTREDAEKEAEKACKEEYFEETAAFCGKEYKRCIHYNIRSYENRNNYSGGRGNYLGAAMYGGWKVYSHLFKYSPLSNLIDKIDECIRNTVKSEKTPETATETSENGKTVSVNEEKDGIEIRFDKKPSEKILKKLNEDGWHWSRYRKIWYKRNTPENMEFAMKEI